MNGKRDIGFLNYLLVKLEEVRQPSKNMKQPFPFLDKTQIDLIIRLVISEERVMIGN